MLAVGHDQSKSVAFYHPDTAGLLGTTSLPKEPVAIVLTDDGTKAYALYESSGIKIAVINTANHVISATWATTGKPVGMVLNGTELLVADSNNNRLVGIHTTTGAVTRTKTLSKEPQMVGIATDSTLIMVGVKNGELQILNASTLAVTRNVAIGDDIRSLAWWNGAGSGNGRVLAVGKSQNALNLVDPANGVVTRVALGGDPNTTGVEQHINWAYIGEKDDQIISLVDLIDRALAGYFTIPGEIGSILFDQQAAVLFVSLTKDDKLLKLDPNQASLISKVGIAKTLKDVAVNSVTSEAVAISSKDADFARINLSNHAVQTLVLPVKADKVVVDSGLNIAIVGATNDKLSFVNLATNPASLYPQQVDLDGNIKDMAVDPTRSITVAVVSDKQRIRVINNITRTEIAQVQTSDKYVAVAIHPGKGIAYLATDNKKLSLFNLTTRTVAQTIALSFDVEGIAVDPTLNRAVLTTKDQDKAWILNLDTLQMVTSLTMAENPGAVAIQTDTHIAVVASKDDDSLSLIDLNTNTATLNFNQIDKPTGLAISNRFNKVLVVSSDKDDLAIVQLANPQASLSAISPTQVAAGASATVLTVNGAHFIDGAVAYFGATALATTWVSSSTLTAIIPAALLTTAVSNNIRVQNPAPAGGSSASIVFTIGTAALPSAPAIGVATAGNGQASITFTASASNGGSAITTYIATSTPGNITGACSAPCTSITIIGLSNGTAYTFVVHATNASGMGAASAASNIVTPATVPGAPTIGLATAGNGHATVAFTAPASNGGSFITSYTATSSPGNLTGSCSAPCTSIIVNGLASGTAYTFTVKATNAIGVGSSSAASNSITLTGSTPVLDSVMPSTAMADNTAKTFTLTGSNFISPMSVVVGTDTFAATSSTLTSAQLTLPASLFSAVGNLSLAVKTAAGTSGTKTISVTPPAPIIISNAPTTLSANSQFQALTLIGTNFIAPVKVRFDGTLITVNPTSATQLTVFIFGTMLTTVKTVAVSVNAEGGESNVLTVNIVAPGPNELPEVRIFQPYGNFYTGGEPITFSAAAYDADGFVQKIELVENNTVLMTEYSSNFGTERLFSGGQHTVIGRATDNRGGIGEASVSFYVTADPNSPFITAWSGMTNALQSGNVDAAVSFLTARAAERYRPIFQALLPNMATIISGWSSLELVGATQDFGEYVISTPTATGRSLFFVYFVKDANGNILIDSM